MKIISPKTLKTRLENQTNISFTDTKHNRTSLDLLFKKFKSSKTGLSRLHEAILIKVITSI